MSSTNWKTRRMRSSSRNTGMSPPSFSRAYTHRLGRRKQRLEELSTITKASLYGQVYPLQKPDYSRDVTEASKLAFVLVHLTSSLGTNIESRLLTEIWRELARNFGDVKFCEIRGDLCIEGYPERNCPTILVYHNGEILRQIITLKQFHGDQTSTEGKSAFRFHHCLSPSSSPSAISSSSN